MVNKPQAAESQKMKLLQPLMPEAYDELMRIRLGTSKKSRIVMEPGSAPEEAAERFMTARETFRLRRGEVGEELDGSTEELQNEYSGV